MNHPQIRSWGLALLACLLLVACATPPEKVERADTPSVKIDETAMLPLLGYLQLLNRMTPQELLRERSMLTSIPQTPATQVRLALLLGQPRAPTDLGRALSLLDLPPGEANGRGRNHPLALLFLPLLQDNRRLDEALAASQLKLREEQKRAEALQQGNEQMRQKLDAIRDIEVKILERPPTK